MLSAIVTERAAIARDAMFIHFGFEQGSPLVAELGCTLGADGTVETFDGERSSVSDVFVAGDASDGLQLIAIASAEGVRAACAINTELRHEQFGRA